MKSLRLTFNVEITAEDRFYIFCSSGNCRTSDLFKLLQAFEMKKSILFKINLYGENYKRVFCTNHPVYKYHFSLALEFPYLSCALLMTHSLDLISSGSLHASCVRHYQRYIPNEVTRLSHCALREPAVESRRSCLLIKFR